MIGEAAALASALLWAASTILMGSQSARVPAVLISALRLLFGAAFVMAVAAILVLTGAAKLPAAGRALEMAGSGALGFGIGDTMYIASLRRIGVSRAFPISTAIYPLLTFVLAVTLLGETITPSVAAGAALTMLGLCLVVLGGGDTRHEAPAPTRSGGQLQQSVVGAVAALPPAVLCSQPPPPNPRRDRWIGLALVAGAAALWAVASVWLRSAAEGEQPLVVQAVRMPAALIVTAVIARHGGYRLEPLRYGGRNLVSMLFTGVVGTGIGSLLFVIALQDAGAARTAVLSSTAPLFGLPMAALWLGERVTPQVMLGTVLSIIGIWLVIV